MSKERRLEELMKVLKSIEIILEDNNQNLQDCKRELLEVKKELFPQTSWIKRLFYKLKKA